jgi:hypothetical protein
MSVVIICALGGRQLPNNSQSGTSTLTAGQSSSECPFFKGFSLIRMQLRSCALAPEPSVTHPQRARSVHLSCACVCSTLYTPNRYIQNLHWATIYSKRAR